MVHVKERRRSSSDATPATPAPASPASQVDQIRWTEGPPMDGGFVDHGCAISHGCKRDSPVLSIRKTFPQLSFLSKF